MARVALITGGAQGIGAASAKKLLEQGFGGVLLLDRNAARLEQEAASLRKLGRVETLAADLADDATPGRAVAFCVEKFGRLDVLLNAAGNTSRGGIGDITPAIYQGLFDVNVKAPLFLMQEAAKVMKQNGGGTIINVSSMIAYGGLPSAWHLFGQQGSADCTHQACRAGICLGWHSQLCHCLGLGSDRRRASNASLTQHAA